MRAQQQDANRQGSDAPDDDNIGDVEPENEDDRQEVASSQTGSSVSGAASEGKWSTN